MYVPAELANLTGEWRGNGSLWFTPDAPAAEFEAGAQVSLAARDNVLCIAYRWSFEGEPQEGLLTLGINADDAAAHASWVDSWHMPAEFMVSHGSYANGGLSVRGSYAAPTGPDWGWRTAIEDAGPDAWRLVMYNIPPDQKELLAFDLRFSRIS